MLTKDVTDVLEKQRYKIVGSHSAVKVCTWTRKSLRDKGFCYKQQFYGIESHRCLQMTPSVSWCTQKCLFCWRNVEQTLGCELSSIDEPKDIIDGAIAAQRRLISGFAGPAETLNKQKFREAQDPNQAAVSLAGEPTIYPRIGELLAEFRKRGFSTFLVTNGTLPRRLQNLEALPTQLYLSMVAPDQEVYNRVCNPQSPGNWERINETIDLLPSINTRKVVRVTLVKGLNMLKPEAYAKMIGRACPDYVEVKAYMFIGASRQRLSFSNMPSYPETEGFAKELSRLSGYRVKDQKRDSRVVLLSRD